MIRFTKTVTLLAALLSFSLFAACESGQVQDDGSQAGGYGMEQAQSFLGDLTYAPYGKGFGYKETSVPKSDFEDWLSRFKPQIEEALNAVGPGFVIQVTGHTDSIGPRFPEGSKKGNVHYSTERAKSVYNALQNMGIPTDKMSYKGIADDEVLPGTANKDRKNRRVTFKIVPQEEN